MNDIGIITLTNGGFTCVDADLFPELNKHRWRRDNQGSVARYKRVNGKFTAIMLHRVVNQTPEGMDTDHINGYRTQDNRRCNLRSVTHQQNAMNMRKGNSRVFASKYKGVTWNKKLSRWQVKITVGKDIHLGLFDSEIEAARAYNRAAVEHFGEFAKLNPV